MSQEVALYLFQKYLKEKCGDTRDDIFQDLIDDTEIGSLIWVVVEEYQRLGNASRIEHLISIIEAKFQRLQDQIDGR